MINKEPSIDIRNYKPEIKDNIEIKGDLSQVLNEEQFNILREHFKIDNFGNDGEINFINLSGLFSIEDIKNKIEEICNYWRK